MTSVAFPFLRISSENIDASPWFVVQDGGPEAVLGDRIEKWDYISKIQLTRSISVNFAGVAIDLGIDPSKLQIAALTTLGAGGVRGERSKQIVLHSKLSADSNSISISIEPSSAELSQAIKLTTEVILDAAATGGRLSPKLRGLRLWADSQTVHVEPNSARFPVEASSFKKLFQDHPQGAFFHLSLTAPDWEQDFSNSIRLYINSDEADFCMRFSAGDETVLRLVMSSIINQLVRRALSNDGFSLDLRSSPPTSISGTIRNWILQAFPNQSLETVRTMSEYNPAVFETALASLGFEDAA
jgi:hypothetical protein